MKQFSSRLLLLLMMCTFVFSACNTSRKSVAIEEGWELIGEKRVDFGKDKDVLMVNSNNQYTDVRFRVEDRPVRIKDFAVVYQNGDRLTPAMDMDFEPGQDSKTFHISPEGRFIRSFEFKYRTKGNVLKGRGSILVFGKRLSAY